MPGHRPSLVMASLWQTPQASILMRTCPVPGSGISRSTISRGRFGRLTCTARIFGIIPPLVVISLACLCARNPWRIQPFTLAARDPRSGPVNLFMMRAQPNSTGSIEARPVRFRGSRRVRRACHRVGHGCRRVGENSRTVPSSSPPLKQTCDTVLRSVPA
jgi:hypothetical protein